jgi:hypothetical protein
VSAQAEVRTEPASPDPAPPERRRRFGRADLVTVLCYLGLGVLVMWPLWRDPAGVKLVGSLEDQYFNEWNLAYAAHVLTDGANPLFTTLMNPPAGANIMANTSNLGVGFVLAPVTLVFGPAVTLVLALTLGLAGTAAAWYRVLSRWLLPADTAGTVIAAVAGGLIGFSPSLVGHAGGTHVQFVSQFLLPFIVWRVTRLAERPVREGVIIGLLVTYQLFLGEEILMMAAMAVAVLLAARLADRPRVAWTTVRRFLTGTAVTAGTVLGLAGYPLWTQFFGPQSYTGIEWSMAPGTPLPGWTAYSTESVAGGQWQTEFALNGAEQNGFLGWAVVGLTIAAAVWLWRRSGTARALTVTAIVFVLLAAGSRIVWAPGEPGIPGPWRLLAPLPIFESILPARFALVSIPCMVVLLALAAHRLTQRFPHRNVRVALVVVAAIALIPIAPTPATVWERPSVPEFFAGGLWKQYVRPGHTLVVAPRPSCYYGDPMRWQYLADFEFRINSGYFISPVGPHRKGTYAPAPRPSELLLDRAYTRNEPQTVTPDDRRAAREDLRAWGADAVVVDPRMPNAEAIRVTVGRLYGVTDRLVGGVWVWDVRNL